MGNAPAPVPAEDALPELDESHLRDFHRRLRYLCDQPVPCYGAARFSGGALQVYTLVPATGHTVPGFDPDGYLRASQPGADLFFRTTTRLPEDDFGWCWPSAQDLVTVLGRYAEGDGSDTARLGELYVTVCGVVLVRPHLETFLDNQLRHQASPVGRWLLELYDALTRSGPLDLPTLQDIAAGFGLDIVAHVFEALVPDDWLLRERVELEVDVDYRRRLQLQADMGEGKERQQSAVDGPD